MSGMFVCLAPWLPPLQGHKKGAGDVITRAWTLGTLGRARVVQLLIHGKRYLGPRQSRDTAVIQPALAPPNFKSRFTMSQSVGLLSLVGNWTKDRNDMLRDEGAVAKGAVYVMGSGCPLIASHATP
ncbi:hypothetical protein PCH_Pc21g22170 [Penicillium rubens Wisconsin 54-1255]|uniref:Uncharacterized protein n=1 Tax=Penicillium rubens (strain ATCC 28089 / DSM 1075 / NRRL 1951 / Wisconsin 54-1255) TaxID=500485 RepID=B6HMZ7_PENRW|nr:hypothetical protein PCH_Pc21g22170 [Penicillium rubens Wisconsin 54-1255]